MCNGGYRDRHGSRTGFAVRVLPTLLASFCREIGGALLDVSGGQGRLAEAIGRGPGDRRAHDDYRRRAWPASHHLRSVALLRGRRRTGSAGSRTRTKGAPFVTSCLDVLEHIDPRTRLRRSAQSCGFDCAPARVSISARPSHTTIFSTHRFFHFPLGSGIRDGRGFTSLSRSHFTLATRQLTSGQDGADPLMERWRAIDLFGDTCRASPVTSFSRRQPMCPTGQRQMPRQRSCLMWLTAGRRAAVPGTPSARFLLSLHHMQEFHFSGPLLDVLRRHTVRVILRPYFIEDLHCRAITGFLARTGVCTHVYERAEALPWSELAGSILVSAADPHVLLITFTASRSRHSRACMDVGPYLLQHGIWPRNFPGRIVTFGSELILTWGAAEERILQQNQHRLAAVDVPWGVFHPGQVRRIGSPRYTDQLLPSIPTA